MTRWRSETWTCDRCGASEVIGVADAGVVDQPLGWAALYDIKPPLKSPADSDKRGDQVCPACLDSYYDWFTAASKIEVVA